MRNRTIVFSLFMLALLSNPAFADGPPRNFSADVISTTPQGAMRMKIFTSGEKSRMEMPDQTMIVRRDLKVMWMIMPTERMYMEQPIDLSMAAQTSPEVQGEVKRESMGRETIDGKNTEKFKVSYTTSGVSGEIYQWMSDEGFPVKMQAVDGSWTVEFKNVQTGTQPDSLFEPPSDFQKMAMPSMADLMRQAGN